MILLLVPVCYAYLEDYSEYEDISFLHTTSSEINVYVTGNDPKIMDLTVQLNLIPRNDYRQSILNQEIISRPSAYVDFDPDFDETLGLNWKNLNTDLIYYEVNSRILTKHIISKIRKIKFPIQNLEWNLDEYTQATEFIDVTQEIREKANEIVEGEDDLYEAVYKLAEWVRINVDYNLNTMTEEVVQKSSWVLMTRQGVCDEITNLFISFCRSLGVPTKFITGVAYSNIIDDFGNHGWAEVYFPGYGWIPFDVTYGEYGWLDATHIKLNEDVDSNVFSVNYNWKSRDVDVKTKDLETKTILISKGNKIESPTRLEVNLLKNNVGFGSYVPIQVVIENLEDYYVADKVFLTKAPEVIGNNAKVILLKPGEIKEEYWLVHIPTEMKSGYKYSSLINIESIFGSSVEDSLYFSKSRDVISKIEAEKKIDDLRKREEKKYFLSLDFDCDLLKEKYYSNENIDIKCDVKNRGNVLLDNLQICLREDCRELDLGISEEQEIKFETYARERITIIAENEDMIKYVYLEPEIIEVPKIEISDLKPAEIDYYETKKFTFILETDYDAYDVELKVEDKKTKFNVLSGKKVIDIELSGNKLINGLDIKVIYKDKEGKSYSKKEKISVIVNNAPWYSRMFGWVFSMI